MNETLNSKPAIWIGLLGFAFLSLMTGLQAGRRILTGQNDFAQIYAGARLSGTAELYSREANYRVIREQIGMTLDGVICTRLPWNFVLWKPLSWMPYGNAYAFFLALNAAALVGFTILARGWLVEAPAFIGWSVPVVLALANGQDSMLLLFIVAFAVYLHQRGYSFVVGLLLSLCTIKFHLFLFVPLVLIFRREWKVIGGGLVGVLLQIAISFAAQGMSWPSQYAAVIANPAITPRVGAMLNLRGAAFALAGRDVSQVWLLLYAITALGCLWIVSRKPTFEAGIAWALVCGLLVSHHAYVQDFVLLLLSFVLILRESRNFVMRVILAATVTPLPYLIPYSVILPAMLLGLVAIQSAIATGFAGLAFFRRPDAVRNLS